MVFSDATILRVAIVSLELVYKTSGRSVSGEVDEVALDEAAKQYPKAYMLGTALFHAIEALHGHEIRPSLDE